MIRPKLILLLVVDCLRADHLSGNGYPRLTSPTLDGLAGQGARFTACYPQGIYTFPSHTSLLTGVHHATHRLSNGDAFPYAVPTMADYLNERGYVTAGFVSNGMLAADRGLGDAFTVYDDGLTPGEANPTFSRAAAATTERALVWLGESSAESQFLFIHYNDCHGPIRLPETYQNLFVNDPYYVPGSPLPIGRGRGVIPAEYALPGHVAPGYYVAQYDAAIRTIDDQISRLLSTLLARWAWEEMLVIVTGDHGEAMGEHGIYFTHGKGFYEEFLRTPLLLGGGAIPAGGVFSQAVRHIDVLPTLLDTLEIVRPDHLDGISLWPWLHGATTSAPVELFDYHRLSAYIRQEDWKYITQLDYSLAPDWHWRQRWRSLLTRPQEELYHLARDPAEQVNLIQHERARARAMRTDLLTRLRRHAAITLTARPQTPATAPDAAAIQQRLQALGYVE